MLLKFSPKGPIDNKSEVVQVAACLHEMMMSKIWGAIKPWSVNSLTPGQNGCHFTDDIFRCIFVNEKFCILIRISLKFVPNFPINNRPALVQVMAWHRPGDKPLSEPMMVSLLTHICITRPQWFNSLALGLISRIDIWGRLNKKDGLTRYGNSHVKDKTS